MSRILVERYLLELNQYLKQLENQKEAFEEVAKLLISTSKFLQGTIYIVGNGGSASTAQHLAQGLLDLGLRAVSVMDNISNITAQSNDLSYKVALKQTLSEILRAEDCIVVISGSGNSENLIELLEDTSVAKVGILGMSGGKAIRSCDLAIVFRGLWYGPLEDAHLVVCHIICEVIKEKLNI